MGLQLQEKQPGDESKLNTYIEIENPDLDFFSESEMEATVENSVS